MTTFVKSSAGRTTTGKPRVQHAEDQPCPAFPGSNHQLTNAGWVTRCCWCGVAWAEIDAELNLRVVEP